MADYKSSRESRGKGRKKHHRKQDSRSDDRSRSPRQLDDSKDLSKNIPGYKDMTPAERVRAKMRLLLEKASDDKTTPLQKTTPLHNTPSQCDILAIESDSFAPKAFHSSRNKKESIETLSSNQDCVMFGDTATPTATPLSLPIIQDNELISVELSGEDLKLKWINKLITLRQQYSTIPID